MTIATCSNPCAANVAVAMVTPPCFVCDTAGALMAPAAEQQPAKETTQSKE